MKITDVIKAGRAMWKCYMANITNSNAYQSVNLVSTFTEKKDK
jgi:hypothetical protein